MVPSLRHKLRKEFVINVSNDHIMERDIDLEIEARMRSVQVSKKKKSLSITSTQETDSIRDDSFSSEFDLVDQTISFQEDVRYTDLTEVDFDDFHMSSSASPSSSKQPLHTRDVALNITKEKVAKKQDEGVFFHFFGGSSFSSSMGNSAPKPQISNGFIPLHHVPSDSSSSSSATTSLLVTTMEKQLTQLEKILQGIESCIPAVKNTSLSPVVIHELELLKKTTDQIRFRGTSAILAEAGKPFTPVVSVLRGLVTRAIDAHKQIDHLSMLAQGK